MKRSSSHANQKRPFGLFHIFFMRRIAITLSVLFQVFVLSGIPALAGPDDLLKAGLTAANADAGYKTDVGISGVIGSMIKILLGLTGVIFLVILVWAGIMYMTAAGDPGKVDKAKKMITQCVIGLIFIVGAYSISSFIITQLAGAV